MESLSNGERHCSINFVHPLKIFDAARKADRFLFACAPMVRYSKLAFRQTCYSLGVDICWTPMILAKEFNRNKFARDSDFTSSSSRNTHDPVIIQFGANSPQELSRASSLAAPWVSGVDLNCGCPQSWACAETLGAALMNQRELARDMIVETRRRLGEEGWGVGLEKDMESSRGRSVSVKIRVHDDLRRTMDWLDCVIGDQQNRNVDWITIHPRTRNMPSTTPIRTEALEILTTKYSKILPVLLSGDVFDTSCLPFKADWDSNTATIATNNNQPVFNNSPGKGFSPPSELQPRPSNTSLSGFMSARGLLCNPALFAGHTSCPWDAVEIFMCNVARAPLPFKLTLHHITEMTGPGMGSDKASLLSKKERALLMETQNMLELVDILDEKMEQKTGRRGGMRRNL